ncbi:hypothetical protein I4U23_009468 [Adineta vaga]|nr:hypothetical protein I4U23_009468 [Adineta vaga]
MGANDSPTATRTIVTDYFDWRLNNRTITNNRLFSIVRKIASDCETAYHAQQPEFNLHFSEPNDPVQTLNNIKSTHNEIGTELFADGGISWTRIITFITFSALLAERIIQQQQAANLPSTLVISSLVDWTSDFINTNLQTWLESQNYWAGCLKLHDKTPQRRNSIGRYAGILGTLGMLTLGALYIRRT